MNRKFNDIIRRGMAALTAAIPFTFSTAAPRALVMPDGIVQLGDFEEQEIQHREVWVKNTGDEPLVVLKCFTTCSCTSVDYPTEPIAAGDSAVMRVTFDGRHRRPGPVRKVFRLTTNGSPAVTSILVTGEIVRPFQK